MANIRQPALACFLLTLVFAACTPEPAPTPPPASSSIASPVTGLKALREGDKVILSWDAHPDAAEYELARSHTKPSLASMASKHFLSRAGDRSAFKKSAAWAGNTTTATTQFEDTLDDYGVFAYKVRAVSVDRRTSPWSDEVSIDAGSPRDFHPFDEFMIACGNVPDAATPEIGFWFSDEPSQAIVICEHSGSLRLAFIKDASESLGLFETQYQEGALAIGAGKLNVSWTYAETERYEADRSIVTVLETPAPDSWSYSFTADGIEVDGVLYMSMFPPAPEGPTEPTDIVYSTAATTTPWNTAADTLGTQLFGAGDDDDFKEIDFPFPVAFYGKPFSTFTVTTNGVVYFGTPGIDGFPIYWEIPNPYDPYMLALVWDDLVVGSGGRVAWAVTGDAPDRTAVITYSKLQTFYLSADKTATFQVEFKEGSPAFTVRYQSVASGFEAIAGTNYGDGESGTSWTIASNTGWLVTPSE